MRVYNRCTRNMLLETYVDKASRKRAYMKAYNAEKADIRLTSGQWEANTRNAMQLVLQGAHGEEIVTISQDRFSLSNGLKRDLAQRLTEGLQLRHAVVGGVDEYTVV